MKIGLLEIPRMNASQQTCWKIRALVVDGRAPALDALLTWRESEEADYKKIMKVMRIVGQRNRVQIEKYIKKSANPAHGDVYEMRADRSHARLMFFYSEDESIIVCTNSYWKNKGNQNIAFGHCAQLRLVYQKSILRK